MTQGLERRAWDLGGWCAFCRNEVADLPSSFSGFCCITVDGGNLENGGNLANPKVKYLLKRGQRNVFSINHTVDTEHLA